MRTRGLLGPFPVGRWHSAGNFLSAGGGTVPVDAPPVNTEQPDFIQPAPSYIGATVSIDNGAWTGYPAPTFTYLWYLDGISTGITTKSYTIPLDAGTKPLRCDVTATNSQGSATAQSVQRVVVDVVPPVNTVPPVVTGTGDVGSVNSCSQGTWTGLFLTYSYQWKVNGVNAGTGNTYVTPAAYGQDITCEVTATNISGSVTEASSNSVTIDDEAPTFEIPFNNPTWEVNAALTPYDASAHFGGGAGTYSFETPIPGVSISAAGEISGTPTNVGQVVTRVVCTNSGGTAYSNYSTVTVTASLAAPIFSGTIPDILTETGEAMIPYNATVNFSTGGFVSEYTLQNAPAWLNIGSDTGIITGTPPADGTSAVTSSSPLAPWMMMGADGL